MTMLRNASSRSSRPRADRTSSSPPTSRTADRGSRDAPADAGRCIDAARRGDPRGHDALYRWLAGPVTAFAHGRGAADPEGITNETFLRVFRSLDSFHGDGVGFRSWVFSIARNLVIDAHRSQQRRPTEVSAALPQGAEPSAEALALAELAGESTLQALACLTDDQRDVIVLRLVADLSLAETAQIVDRPVTAVKRLQARALRRLQREILAEEVSS